MQWIETTIVGILCFMLGGAMVGWSGNKEMKERADDLNYCWMDRDFLAGVAFPSGGGYAIRDRGRDQTRGHSAVRKVQVGQQVHKAHGRSDADKQKIHPSSVPSEGLPIQANRGRTLGKKNSQVGVYFDAAIHSTEAE